MEARISLFGMPLTGYGLMAALSLLITLLAAALYARRYGARPGSGIRLAVLAIPLCLIVSRLVFVLANCTYYLVTLGNPALALYFWDGGYAAMGALMGLVLAAFLAEKWTRSPRGVLLDAALCAAPLGLCLLRLAEDTSRLGLGRTISYEWLYFLGVDDGYGDLVHPVCRYEAAAALLIFIILAVWLLCRRHPAPRGDVALTSLTLICASQVILESLRNDGHMVVHFVRIQQVLALLGLVAVFAICLARLARLSGMKKSLQLALWLVTVVCIGLGIFLEFRVDRGSLKIVYYAGMIACMGLITAMALIGRHKAEALR